jgi:hypothetical protein
MAADHRTYLQLNKQGFFTDRIAVISDIRRFESEVASTAGVRVSWYAVLSMLKGIYNPETQTGAIIHRDSVLDLLAATDLYFGLLSLMLRQSFLSGSIVTIRQIQANHPHLFTRLQAATESFLAKFKSLAVSFSELELLDERLAGFFSESQNMVAWIEFGEQYVSLVNQPLDLRDAVKKLNIPDQRLVFVDNLNYQPLLSYSLARLGFTGLRQVELGEPILPKVPALLIERNIELSELSECITPESLPMVIVFEQVSDLKTFYNRYYEQLKQIGSIFAEKYTGGTTKLFRNFLIRSESLLLISAETFVRTRVKLPVKTLLVTSARFAPSNHPYAEALKARWQAEFSNFDQLRQAGVFHEILQQCQLEKLERCLVYGLDALSSQTIIDLFTRAKMFSIEKDIHR